MRESLVWKQAARFGAKTVPAGPSASAAMRRATVARLRKGALEGPAWVAEITGLQRAAQQSAATTEVLVVDRAGWINANARYLEQLLAPLAIHNRASLRAVALRHRAAAVQIGGALALTSSRLLGQVQPPTQTSSIGATPGARMLLVAPNVLQLEQDLKLDAMDLPVWVTMHETVHAVQLNAAPWLSTYLTETTRELLGSVSARADHGSALEIIANLASAVREPTGETGSLLDQLLTPTEIALLEQLLATTTFLEGHTETVLDAVDPAQLPSVHRLRTAMAHLRGQHTSVGSTLLQRMTGLAGKLGQYENGANFARQIVQAVGHTGLNRVWSGPEMLPTPAEISAPNSWLERTQP